MKTHNKITRVIFRNPEYFAGRRSISFCQGPRAGCRSLGRVLDPPASRSCWIPRLLFPACCLAQFVIKPVFTGLKTIFQCVYFFLRISVCISCPNSIQHKLAYSRIARLDLFPKSLKKRFLSKKKAN